MDMTVTEIGAVVVAELRAAGYLESTIGQSSDWAVQRAAAAGLRPAHRRVRLLRSYRSGGPVGSRPRRRRAEARQGQHGDVRRRVGRGDGPPGPGAGHARRLPAGGARLPGVPGATAGPVGVVVAVLGGVELPPVPDVHWPR